jgi:glycosyltransferase involved in cell wall biosynthesis
VRVLQINNFHFKKGGSEAVYFNTSDILQSHGNEVFYFSINHPQNIGSKFSKFFADQSDYRSLPLYKKVINSKSFIFNNNSAQALSNLIEIYKPDIAHIHLFLGGLTTSILKVLTHYKIPVIHTAHDYRLICPSYLCMNGKGNVCIKCISDKFYLRCTLNKCSEGNYSQSLMLTFDSYFRKYFINPKNFIDHFIFVSSFSRTKHIQFDQAYNFKSSLLYNFIPDLKKIDANSSKGKYFLYFGRLSREKGVEFLIDAVRDINVEIKIVGTGPLYSSLEKKKPENVQLVGYKSGDELKNLIDNASFVVVPSQWYENNPLTILESFSFGKPVIGSSIGGIPELIKDGENGFLFKPDDKIGLLSAIRKAEEMNADEYKSFSENARAFAEENFDPDKYYKELLKIYTNAIQNKLNG